MIKSFSDKQTEQFWRTGKSRKLPNDIQKRAYLKLQLIEAAVDLDILRVPPANKLEALRGDREGKYSIRINDQWRICFRFESGNAHEVEIVDYHR